MSLAKQTPSGSEPAPISLRMAEAVSGYMLATPAFVLLILFMLGPAVAVFVIAVSDWQFGAQTMTFIGLDNFRSMVTDPVFRASFVNTVIYVAIVVPGTVILGLAIAILIEAGSTFRTFYRAAHFLPVMATLAAMAIVWEAMLHPTIGLVNQLLGEIGIPAPNWLRDRSTVLPTLAVIGIWQHLGFTMVLFLAGLKAIPQDLYDAAEVDGADSTIDRLFTVTLPMLSPVMMFVLILAALQSFQVFDTVKILTQGGPNNASEVLLHTLYVESFEFFRTGYGAAMTVVFLVIIVTLTLTQAKILDKRVHYS